MRIELQSGGLQLGRGQVLSVHDGAGSTICARTGSVWITEENQARDIVLDPGGCYCLRHPGLAIVQAPVGEAHITISGRRLP
jgi:hypothetical protein